MPTKLPEFEYPVAPAAAVVNPLIDRVAMRAQQTVHVAAVEVEHVIHAAGAEVRNAHAVVQEQLQATLADADRRGRRVLGEARWRFGEVVAHADRALQARIFQWQVAHEDLADAWMARIATLLVVAFLAYGAYFAAAQRHLADGPLGIVLYTWTGVTALLLAAGAVTAVAQSWRHARIILKWCVTTWVMLTFAYLALGLTQWILG